MGCRNMFVVDLVEEIVGEGGSRSSWLVHEHDSSQLVSQQNVATRVFWSRSRLPLNALIGSKQRVSPFYRVLLHLPLWSSCRHERNVGESFAQSRQQLVARDFPHGKQRVAPFYHDLGLDLVGLIGNIWIVEQLLVVQQLLNPISFIQSCFKEIFWGGRGDAHTFLVYHFSSFHPNNFRDTMSWECIAKNGGVRSRLIELQSFLHSKMNVDPIHRVLMFLPCCMHVPCKTRRFQVDRVRMLLFLSMGSTGRKNTVCLLLKFWPPGINPELMMECKLIAHPMWWKYSKKSLGINALSCNEGSMRLRPEWPWRARR